MQVQYNVPLQPFNTFGISAVAKAFARFDSVESLQTLLSNNADELLILGGGSNILFTNNFDGLVLKNEIKGITLTAEDEQYFYVQVAAGEVWHQFVLHCIAHNYAGVENLSLIPGNVGASPMQNIGAYGVEIKDVFHSLQAYHIATGEVHTFSLQDCAFGYRESVFKRKLKNQYVILNVTFKLLKHPQLNTSYGAIEQELQHMNISQVSIQAISQAVINIRSSKLPNPAEIGNAGSFFKNPTIATAVFAQLQQQHPTMPNYPSIDTKGNAAVKLAAGWLIEQCGWKGYRKDDAGCHAKQALVLVNYGHASGSEIYSLSQAIINSVQEKFGITLEREVNIIPIPSA